MSENLQSTLLIAFALLCLLPLVIVLVLGFILFRLGRSRLDDFLNPDTARLEARFEALRASNPAASDEELVGKIIHGQALRCGLVGAITGVGGFFTLPIALPVDIVASLYLQAGLVNFIAQHFGGDKVGDLEKHARTYMIVSGGGKIAETTFSAMMSFLLRVIGKSLTKLIPFFGAIMSFALNYAIAQAIGRLALRWYSRGQPTLAEAERVRLRSNFQAALAKIPDVEPDEADRL